MIQESYQGYLQRHRDTVTMSEAEFRAWADRSYCDWASIDTDAGTYIQRNEDDIRVLIGRGEIARQRRFHPADPFGDEHYIKEKEEDNRSSSEKILLREDDPQASAISLPWYGEAADWHDAYGYRENGRRATFWVRWQRKNEDDDLSSTWTLATRISQTSAGSIISDQSEGYDDDANQPPATIDLYNELKEETMWERLQTRSLQWREHLSKQRKRERVKKGFKKAVGKMKVW